MAVTGFLCPGCGCRATWWSTAEEAFCYNPDCVVLRWDPRKSRTDNLAHKHTL